MNRHLVVTTACLLIVGATPSGASEPHQLTFSGTDGIPSWSPSGTHVVFSSSRAGSDGQDLWIVPTIGGDAIQLTNEVSNEYGAAWSPDGSTIAYYWAWEADLYVVPAAGGKAQPFATSPGSDSEPAWAPDGSAIAFTSNRGTTPGKFDDDIWVQPYPTGAAVPLTTSDADDFDPTFSPDGATIAFISDRDGPPQLWTIPSAGGSPTRVTDLPALEPSWSPTGEWIAFSSQGDLYTVAPGGGDPVPVTTGTALDLYPAWSPSGSQIVFTRRVGSDLNLWIVEIAPTSIEPDSWGGIKARFRNLRR
jgi:TolB protein